MTVNAKAEVRVVAMDASTMLGLEVTLNTCEITKLVPGGQVRRGGMHINILSFNFTYLKIRK